MKILKENPLVNEFLQGVITTWDPEDVVTPRLVEQLIAGIIVQQKPSANKIHDRATTGPSKRTFYRDIHALAARMPALYRRVFANVQQDPKIAMRPGGVLSLDEHVVPHASEDMEGVDYLYSTTEQGTVLGLSLMAVHYFHKTAEYPVDLGIYRRLHELEKWGKAGEFKEKNELARELFARVSAMPNTPATWLMDSYFMTKENVRVLKGLKKDYVSRPKRSWKCTYQRQHYTFGELFDAVSPGDFKLTMVKNPKTGKVKFYHAATRDVFIPGIGPHLVVLIPCGSVKEAGDALEEQSEEIEAPSKRKFRMFVTNRRDWDASTVLSMYSLRWTIETCFQDLSQHLGVHGCKWRELDGQYCFVALAFLCYLFLTWARARGLLDRYGTELKSLGQAREAFTNYCQEQFGAWLANIKQKCEDCAPANWIHEHVFGGGREE